MSTLKLSLHTLRPLNPRQIARGRILRQFSTSLVLRTSKHDDTTTSHLPKALGKQEGESARTRADVRFQYPHSSSLPPTDPAKGYSGRQHKPTLPSFSLDGKVAVVTGGARGLGLVMAQGLMTSGAEIALVDLNVAEAKASASKMLDTFREENPEAESVPNVTAHYADVSDPSSVDNAISSILSEHKKIDVLVTSAGFTENFDAISYPIDRIRKLWGVNVDGTWLFSVAVAKHLIERNAPGSIVMISSMSAAIVNVPQPQAPYNASKAAVRHMAASFAVEWADKGIRVNCISPGYMLTALTQKILDDKPDLKKKWTSLIPMGKMGRPEDLMGAVTFLASDASLYVTGADLRVDGGYTVT